MTWFKIDDQLHDHRKVRVVDDLAAMGLWTLAGSWSGANRTDGFVPESVLRRWSGSWKRLAEKLVRAEFWTVAERDGERGFEFHDWSDWQPSKEETTTDIGRLRWRRKNALSKNRDLCEQVVARDRGQCRYCAVRVNWQDRRGKTGGTYDHVDPDGENTLENVVVACRRCNGRKRDRTPTEAGMVLLPAPAPYEEPVREPERSQVGVGAHQAPPTRDGAEPDRVGIGVGSDSGRVPAPASNGNGHKP